MRNEQEMAPGGVKETPSREREQDEEVVIPPQGSQVYPMLLNPAGASSTYVGTWHPTLPAPVLTESDIRALVAHWLREAAACVQRIREMFLTQKKGWYYA